MGNRTSHPSVVSYEEAVDGLDADMLARVNHLFSFFKDKSGVVSGHMFWKDFLQIDQVKGAEALNQDTLWRLFVTLNSRGGGYLTYSEFVTACYILVKPEDRIKQTLVFAAFCEDHGASGRMSLVELKQMLMELVIGARTSEWRAYPRRNVTMDDFDPLIALMAEAAIARTSKSSKSGSSSSGSSSSSSSTSSTSSGNSSSGSKKNRHQHHY
eukprot:INCI651.2.p1 GENE.INCI651.2~~INCI651.2.p1  ORF type:complete len:212 (-),score=39.52 INCI651.2:398-1033(-)